MTAWDSAGYWSGVSVWDKRVGNRIGLRGRDKIALRAGKVINH